MRTTRSWLIVVTAWWSLGCSTAPAESSQPVKTSSPPAPSITFDIGAVTPEKLATSGDQVAVQTLTVAYSIPDPETVTEAQLKLYIGELGDVATQTITPQKTGTVQFNVEPRTHSLGPWVRFRAACPQGVTDWYALGQMPLEANERMRKVFRIGSVDPQSVGFSQGLGEAQAGAGVRVSVWGPGLPTDCRIEAQVNGYAVELANVQYVNSSYQGLLMFQDIGFRSISPRYAELKLLVNRSGRRVVATKRLPFVEP